jgi:phosphoribosyl-ATP pyrophosphohydrolase/phosphoribosyl-AMP cyclohydrolase
MIQLTDLSDIRFDPATQLAPCIVQDAATRNVLMLGYMNAEAVKKTLAEKKVTFYSRSKQRLWTKGETSGHFLLVDDCLLDCDRDTVLIKARPAGPVCHTGAATCFEARNEGAVLHVLEQLVQDRKSNPAEGSYTSRLFQEGINRIAQKVGEEAVEMAIEAKDENRDRFLNEAADLMYHYLVLLAAKNCTLADVEAVLQARQKK